MICNFLVSNYDFLNRKIYNMLSYRELFQESMYKPYD
jgi:hypothetical protein